MIDRVLFLVNDDVTDETVLAVLSAIQAFENNAILKNNAHNRAHKQNRPLDIRISVVCNNPEYDILWTKCVATILYIFRNESSATDTALDKKIIWTYVTEISVERAKEIGNSTNRPLAESLGILIGSEAGSLPDVSNLCTEFTEHIYALIDSSLPKTSLDSDTTKTRLKYQFNSSHIANGTFLEKIQAVFSSKIVIGYSSFETYLASALKKPVLEIQKYANLYKWSNPKYFCLVENAHNFEEYLAKGVALCQLHVGE